MPRQEQPITDSIMPLHRRNFLKVFGALGTAAYAMPAFAEPIPQGKRIYHLSVGCETLEKYPDLLENVIAAGVSELWLTGFWAGNWHADPDRLKKWCERLGKRGLAAHALNVPLGHPDGGNPKWPRYIRPDGSACTGTVLHPPATEENCTAMRQLQAVGIDRVFLDDDFRLASSPGAIGGCCCPEHKREFLDRSGLRTDSAWNDLLDAIKHRRLTPAVRLWVDFTCDQLTACFRAQQKAAPNIQLGIMVMYFGSEKAGIRLREYNDVPFRVGEFMFSDPFFNPTKGKTDELYGVLFHRRFVRPELAYSETTAFPDNSLSLPNKLAKLATSTIADVRNTMFMCDFPSGDWPTLAPAMKHHAQVHSVIAGHKPAGPLKHYWGEAARYVGDDNPNSLWLALGIPFSVTDSLANDGYTFLAEADAEVIDSLPAAATSLLARPQAGLSSKVRALAESWPELLAWKRTILPQLGKVPYVEGDMPVVCAWYPTARAVVLWNLGEQRQDFRLRYGDTQRTISVNGLDVALLESIG